MRIVGIVLGATLLLGTGVASAGPSTSEPVMDSSFYQRTELYFGAGLKDGGEVTPAEFEKFLDAKVTPRFPDGLTVIPARGQWRNPAGVITKEPSYLLILLYRGDREANGKIQQIREDYKHDYKQDSVLRADSVERVSF
ncbi:DUF3574 domain-containing protein [Pseudonocardiaceae bacterium YIM PH 21723]|nr:DUF3574 domain-containing protein [Pseudonocardiaceae bacterium YIM PH 21723]